MENASKALIIAGAILLAILIISLGIMIFNQAKGAIDGSQIDQLEMQNFNSKFTQYEGEAVRGSTVNTMIQAVVANNLAQDDAARKVKVYFSANALTSSGAAAGGAAGGGAAGAGATTELGEDDSTALKVSTGATYKVSCYIDNTNSDKGLVSSILVTKKGDTEPTASDSDE